MSLLRITPSSTTKSISTLHSKWHQTIQRSNRYLSTYYDSQSGLHLPIHDESKIQLFLNLSSQKEEPFIPYNLSKDETLGIELVQKLQDFAKKGIHGLILPPLVFPRDVRNLITLSAIAPSTFTFIISAPDEDEAGVIHANGIPKTNSSETTQPTFSKMLYYHKQETNPTLLSTFVSQNVHTTLSITADTFQKVEPITLANNVASMIDTHGGCHHLHLSSSSSSSQKTEVADTMVQVCEELIYLDVAGATIKSRLIVDHVVEEDSLLGDVLFAGVNKFVVQDEEEEVGLVEEVVEGLGKSLLRI